MAHPYAHLYIWSEASLALADRFRSRLLEAGFTESRWSREGRFADPRNQLRFFRQDTAQTAYFVNLEPAKHGLRISYGFDSTAFAQCKSEAEALLDMGLDEDDACLRWSVPIAAAEDPAARQIADHFRQYHGTEKNDLLNIRKELRKAFLGKIHAVLKPLGFRKKGNEWRKVLPSGHTLYFLADKSSYSDCYDFPVTLQAPRWEVLPGDWCLFTVLNLPDLRLPNPFSRKFNWQLNTDEDLREILDLFVKTYHDPLLSGPVDPPIPKLLCVQKSCPVAECPLRPIRKEP